MEALQPAAIAFEGLRLLIGLIGGGVALAKATPADGARICYQELAHHGGEAVCPRDFTGFTMPEPDAHWAVRR